MKNEPARGGVRSVPLSERKIVDAVARATATLIALLAFASAAHAHPGHDLLDHGAAHLATNPFHLLILASVGIALAVAMKFAMNARARIVLQICAIACIVLAAILTVLR